MISGPTSEFDADLPHAFELFRDAITGQKTFRSSPSPKPPTARP